ncbi:MAG: bacterioferritin-associated ferredoxin [Phycisphaerae bacterium]
MKPDDRICYCFHVSLRKLAHYARRERIRKASQLSGCLGAGTGCGWCIPFLKKIHDLAQTGAEIYDGESVPGLPDAAQAYAAARRDYLRSDEKNTF